MQGTLDREGSGRDGELDGRDSDEVIPGMGCQGHNNSVLYGSGRAGDSDYDDEVC